MSDKVYLSGAQKRRNKKLTEEHTSKLPKLTSYFETIPTQDKGNCVSDCATSSSIQAQVSPSVDSNVVVCQTRAETSEPNDANTNLPVLLELNTGSFCTKENPTDIGHYKDCKLTTEDKKFIIDNGSCRPSGPFKKDERGRSFHISQYHTVTKAGLKILRSWLCYSKILQKCYCEPCWLFGDKTSTNQNWVKGYSDWHNINRGIQNHEQSEEHRTACAAFSLFKKNGTVTERQERQIRDEEMYWRKVLDRVIHVIITLASNDIPFRGHREYGDESKGKFIAIIELLSKYDPILADLLRKPKGSIKYLSPQIQNELISVVGEKIKSDILDDVRKALFFSYITDSTQDISKIDQQSTVYRYVKLEENEEGLPTDIKIYESFIGFEELTGQTGIELEKQAYSNFDENNVDLKKLRGLGFDGAANMSGVYEGLQARIREKQPLAIYVHCATHNLNLVINDSVKRITEITIFYDKVECLYVFFAGSIKRWSLLKNATSTVGLILKKLCATRWSSRNNCLRALRTLYKDVMLLLAYIGLQGRNKAEKDEALALRNYFQKFEVILMIVMESQILNTLNTVSLILQTKEVDLGKASAMLGSAHESMLVMRGNFPGILESAHELAEEWGVKPDYAKRRVRKVPRHMDELSSDERLQDPEKYFESQIFYGSLDIIISQLKNRFSGLNVTVKLFAPIFVENIISMKDSELKLSAETLVEKYNNDLSPDLVNQLLQLKYSFSNELARLKSVYDLAKFLLVENHVVSTSFSEVCTACLLFLTIPVTVATAERSFSKLKLIKTYLRSTMLQKRLSSLAIISIEKDRARRINTSEIVNAFANKKSRRKL